MLKSIDVWGRLFIKYKMTNCSFQQLLQYNLSFFYLNTRKTLSLRGFILKPTETAYVLLKNGTRHFLHWYFFMWPSLEILKKGLRQIFWKVKTFFTKMEVTFYFRYCIMGSGVGTLSRKTRLALAVVVWITHYSLYPLVLNK